MTEYIISKNEDEGDIQDTLIDIPPTREDLDRDYQDPGEMTTWKDREAQVPDRPSDLSEHGASDKSPSVANYLGKLSLRTQNARGNRDRFITTFRWVPYTEGEASTALMRLKNRVNVNSKTRRGNPKEAVEDALKNVDRYRANATIILNTLQEALKTPEPRETDDPSVDLIKSNYAVRIVLSEFMLAKESLDNFDWHPRKTGKKPNKKTDQRLQFLNGLIDKASDEDLTRLWHQTYKTNQMRLKFWQSEVEENAGENSESQSDDDRLIGADKAREMLDKLNENPPSEE
jgi:hypothetical protein